MPFEEFSFYESLSLSFAAVPLLLFATVADERLWMPPVRVWGLGLGFRVLQRLFYKLQKIMPNGQAWFKQTGPLCSGGFRAQGEGLRFRA